MSSPREQLLATLRERILAYATSRVGRDCAEDLAQEVLLLLETKYGNVQVIDELLPLAFQIIRFKINDFRKKAGRRGELNPVSVDDLPLASGENVLANLERQELRRRLLTAVAQMHGHCRELFRRKLQGESYDQIRVAMGVESINTIYTWDHRCRQQLMKLLGVKREYVV
ncbi:MAG: RNA polymerase sigma factor [Bryobacterales bacterium]|nr:RNA polymerase sigma factor [Bryobacterales bacterium]